MEKQTDKQPIGVFEHLFYILVVYVVFYTLPVYLVKQIGFFITHR